MKNIIFLVLSSMIPLSVSSSIYAAECTCPANFYYTSVPANNVIICSASVGVAFPKNAVLKTDEIYSGGKVGFAWPVSADDIKNNTVDFSSCDSGGPVKGDHSIDTATNTAYCYWWIDWTAFQNINTTQSNIYGYSSPPGTYNSVDNSDGTPLEGPGAVGFALKWETVDGGQPACSL